jgi:hypothetical protein
MKALYLLLVPSVLLGQEVSPPQRGEERREPNRVERPEPVRSHPPQPESPRVPEPVGPPESPRPETSRPYTPVPVWNVDPFIGLQDCWNRYATGRWNCRPWIAVEMDMSRRNRTLEDRRRPNRNQLTERQRRQLRALREEFIRKRNRILNNP